MIAFLLAGCQTTIVPPAGSNVVQRDGVLEITPRDPPASADPVCLVRARFFRGLVGVRCSDLAQEIRP